MREKKGGSLSLNSAPAPFTIGESHFLGIGVNAYQHFDKLKNAANDVQDLARLLADRYGFLYQEDNFLLNEAATRSNILKALRRFAEDKSIQPHDRLLIYYSGHGYWDEHTKSGFWIPCNAEEGEVEDFVPNSRVQEIIKSISCRHILLISDSCFSGSLLVRGGKNAEGAFEDWERNKSRWVFASGKGVVMDGTDRNSPFAGAILKTLEENKEALNINLLADQVTKRVKFNYEQQAEAAPLLGAGHDGGQFIFRHKVDEAVLAKEREDKAWTAACLANTRKAYLDFEKDFPASTYVTGGETEQRINALEEAELWRQATVSDTIGAYRSYKRRSLLHLHDIEADRAIERLSLIGVEAAKPETENLQAHVQKAPPRVSYENPYSSTGSSFNRGRRINKNELLAYILSSFTILAFVLSIWQPWKTDKSQQQTSQVLPSTPIDTTKTDAPTAKDTNKTNIQPPITPAKPADKDSDGIPDGEDDCPYEKGIVAKKGCPEEKAFSDPFTGQMVEIEGDAFMMGDDKSEETNEKTAHAVHVRDFKMSKYEVTQKQWKAVMGINPSKFKCENCPVENVSWDDIQDFLKKLNQKTELKYRLPTEAEWEFAARGGTKTQKYKYSGNDNLDEVAWFGGNSGDKTHPIGGKKANELGLYDMSGNVWEWCEDIYHDTYKGAPDDGRAWLGEGALRVYRGGSSFTFAQGCRPSYRGNLSPRNRHDYLGFRLALSLQ
ncbi:MAG: SUMF1/EgtB/PvdO family nonheme iron enzyme [Saprospiraceae bacterium]|nr:SUMF1/EgtB/PvdO family nonheme iron enzyme [Saprospiraceae bacterium]